MARDKVDLPEGLWGEVEERFGQAANTKSGIYAAAAVVRRRTLRRRTRRAAAAHYRRAGG